MAADPLPRRKEAHRLIDLLPEDAVEPVVWFLRRVQDPIIRPLDAAPVDDEPLTPEDEAAIEAGREAYRRGEGVPLEQLVAELDGEADS